jgi:hypothetical protein
VKIIYSIILIALFFLPVPLQSETAAAPFSQAKFVPDLALILDFSWLSRNVSDKSYNGLEIPGLLQAQELSGQGFNLNYAELAISAAVDPYFDLFTTFHLSAGEFEIEEAYFKTRQLPLGLQMKAGKFLSHFGRMNGQHEHIWNFNDAPLILKTFFGAEGLNEKGVQIGWLAPTRFYLLLGTEILAGDNEVSFGREGFLEVKDVPMPGLLTTFIQSSADVGKISFLGGVSLALGKSRLNNLDDKETPQALATNTTLAGADLTARLTIDSYRYLLLQGEFILRRSRGDLFQDGLPQAVCKNQSGFYCDLIWRFDRRFKAGVRLDMVSGNRIEVAGERTILPDDLWGLSAALDFTPTEFSRLRLQYRYDHAQFSENERTPIHELSIGVNLAIGAHGAHPF